MICVYKVYTLAQSKIKCKSLFIRMSRKSLTKINLYEELRRQIITMVIKPGTILDEKSLVTRYKLSRTPVREALIRLSADGLVDIHNNRGAMVTLLDIQTLQAVFEASDYIERAYVRLACLRRTQDDLKTIETSMLAFEQALANKDIIAMVETNTQFHLDIAAASRNQYFVDSYRRILADHERIAQWIYSDTLNGHQQMNATILQQHREIFAAISAGDADTAERVSMEHAMICKDNVREMLSNSDGWLNGIPLPDQQIQ